MLKVELHCHLDGSLNVGFVDEVLRKQGLFYEPEELKRKLRVSRECRSLTEYLQKFELPLLCLQTKERLHRAAYELVRDVSLEGVRYIEVRFAPMLSTVQGLTCRQAIAGVIEGLQEAGAEHGVYASAIVCAMRHHSLKQNIEMLEAARDFVGKGVCALDLAGDESAFPTVLFRELFQKANEWGFPFTIHSGECGNVENVRTAIELGAKRLGHGIALEKSAELRKLCRERGIGIEMCPTSNLQTKAVQGMGDYPLEQFLNEGLLVSVHTDNRTVSDTDLEQEQAYFSEDVVRICTMNAIQTAFTTEEIKQKLMEEFSHGEEIGKSTGNH